MTWSPYNKAAEASSDEVSIASMVGMARILYFSLSDFKTHCSFAKLLAKLSAQLLISKVFISIMSSLTLTQQNRDLLSQLWTDDKWVIACLCAAWCGTCDTYRPGFDAWSARHPDKCFVWIDIEDQADIVGEIDVDNFPTLLIQRGNAVTFFGTVLPDHALSERLLMAQVEKMQQVQESVEVVAEQKAGQKSYNLRTLLRNTDSSDLS